MGKKSRRGRESRGADAKIELKEGIRGRAEVKKRMEGMEGGEMCRQRDGWKQGGE